MNFERDIAPVLPLWLETFGAMKPEILECLFQRAMRMCKFFPKVAEILEPLRKAEDLATPEAAEEAWQQVLTLRRAEWNPDMPGRLSKCLARLSERTRTAARAAGVFRDFESVDALHTWAKKRFIESFIAWGEIEQNKFLLPDGEIKLLLADTARPKALPVAEVPFEDLHERGQKYAEQIKAAIPAASRQITRPARLWESDEERELAYSALGARETDPKRAEEIRRQKAALKAKWFPAEVRA